MNCSVRDIKDDVVMVFRGTRREFDVNVSRAAMSCFTAAKIKQLIARHIEEEFLLVEILMKFVSRDGILFVPNH